MAVFGPGLKLAAHERMLCGLDMETVALAAVRNVMRLPRPECALLTCTAYRVSEDPATEEYFCDKV